MRRFALAIIVALLTISASGVSSVVMPEPCGSNELARSDNVCPPTCVTCGCCAQAVEQVPLTLPSLPEVPVAEIAALLPRLPKSEPGDILHVPKLRYA